jgi:hypothetical protein
MKITHELESEYTAKLESKDDEVFEIKGKYNDAIREVELLQEKLRLKEKSTNNIIE